MVMDRSKWTLERIIMTVSELLQGWDNTDGNVKIMALNRVIAEALSSFTQGDELLVQKIFELAETLNEDDYFGTEGLQL